jgi:hypothetical protein
VQGLGHDEHIGRRVADGGQAALPVGPAPGVRVALRVGEDHLARWRLLHIPAERQVLLIASRITHFKITTDRREVEDRDRYRVRE